MPGILRSRDELIETHIITAKKQQSVLAKVRALWALLRDKGLVDANPVKIFTSKDNRNVTVLSFKWRNRKAQKNALNDQEVADAWKSIDSESTDRTQLAKLNEAYQGFESTRFPLRGGVELLRGKCTCTVKLDQFDQPFELDGQNGFVIMHRGPRLSLDRSSLMPVTILAHGADSPVASVMSGVSGQIRVEQNTELPQFGIIRSLSTADDQEHPDFPATAMWVVHWRVHTPIGTIITDPNVPLVFGPTTVHHYPPVGTEFKSSTGPVRVMNAETGQTVGTLTPGELTAFDIVVTMDDEIPSILDKPALYHVQMFNKIVAEADQTISTESLLNDFRVPLHIAASITD